MAAACFCSRRNEGKKNFVTHSSIAYPRDHLFVEESNVFPGSDDELSIKSDQTRPECLYRVRFVRFAFFENPLETTLLRDVVSLFRKTPKDPCKTLLRYVQYCQSAQRLCVFQPLWYGARQQVPKLEDTVFVNLNPRFYRCKRVRVEVPQRANE